MADDDVVVLFNNFGEIARKIKAIGADAVAESVNRIEADVKSKWPNRRRIPVKTRISAKDGRLLGEVVAGSRRRFTPIFDEYGTQFRPARPAMTPAAERERPHFMAKVADLEYELGR